jgi:hypothetical protein
MGGAVRRALCDRDRRTPAAAAPGAAETLRAQNVRHLQQETQMDDRRRDNLLRLQAQAGKGESCMTETMTAEKSEVLNTANDRLLVWAWVETIGGAITQTVISLNLSHHRRRTKTFYGSSRLSDAAAWIRDEMSRRGTSQ